MDSFEILRSIIAPILSVILSIVTITILISSYFLVFRIKRYINKSKFFLDFIKKLTRTINNSELHAGHMHQDDISGSDLEQNKKMIYEMLTKFKSADLKDIIIGTYKEELSKVNNMIIYNYRAMRKNYNFLKFQRLFHVYYKGTTRLLFLDNSYISFYKIHRRYVEIGVVKKEVVEKFSTNFTKENLATFYEKEIHHLASTYNLYFFGKNFMMKNMRNPNQELEKKLNELKPIYREVIKSKNKNFNIYLQCNFTELLNAKDTQKTFIQDYGLILEPVTSKARARLAEEARQIKEIRDLKRASKKQHSKQATVTKNIDHTKKKDDTKNS